FGLLLECDFVLAITAEISLGEKYSRSWTVNTLREYDFRYRSLADLIHRNRKTQIFAVYGAYDIVDLSLLWPVAYDIERRERLQLFMVSGDHKAAVQLDIDRILGR